jgi:hypothetical protein
MLPGLNLEIERILALSLAKEYYAMNLDLLSSATVIDRAVKFVDRNRGLIPQNKEVRKQMTLQNLSRILDERTCEIHQ